MTITDLNDLKKLLKLCQAHKVKSITVDGITLELNESQIEYTTKRAKPINLGSLTNVDEDVRIPQMPASFDDLTEEQKLSWSVAGNE